MAENTKEDSFSESNDTRNEDETIITMVDVLEEEKQLEEDAFAVLGASDDKNCTYSQGYVKRQALYACKTCNSENKKLAGICLACSYHCHEGHDLIELYTKRNFRCDCGNSLFGNKSCNLEPNKQEVNDANKYNQNFEGVYCTCSRPYPDPEDSVQDTMIQCIICEDWYHTRHLNNSAVPGPDDYSEMICSSCTDRLSFLRYYIGYSVNKVENDTTSDDGKLLSVCDDGVAKTEETDVNIKEEDKKEHIENVDGEKSAEVVNDVPVSKAATSCVTVDNESTDDNTGCKLKSMSDAAQLNGNCKQASFWKETFRTDLCRCSSCLDMYSSLDVSFLLNTWDTVQEYEEEGTRRNGSRVGSSHEQVCLEALSSLDRVKQVEAIHRYNEMQEHLKEYLTKFAKNKKVVRAEDIKEFFSEMESRKRQRVDSVPHFCR